MPHKHKRTQKDDKDFDLPPNTIAKPLSVSKSKPINAANPSKKNTSQPAVAGKKRKRNKPGDDDTPKAFARLMAFQQGLKPKSGLDNGIRQPKVPKKRKIVKNDAEVKVTGQEDAQRQEGTEDKDRAKPEIPTIMPGERMADFSARVDAALPLGKLVSKGNMKIDGVKRPRTRIEKKITRMQDEWRERDKRMKNKIAEAEEDAEIEAILNGEEGATASRILEDRDEAATNKEKKGKKSKKGKKKKGGIGEKDSDDDPWAAVAKARKASEKESTGLTGVHDVVQEPPRFAVKLKEKFKPRDGVMIRI